MKKIKKKDPVSYKKRSYRALVDPAGLVSSMVRVQETDLHILAPVDVVEQATDLVLRYRGQLEQYIAGRSEFLSAMRPIKHDSLAPRIAREMMMAAAKAEVGPMAAVAGIIAEFVGRDLLAGGLDEVMVENGGDIFIHRKKDCIIGIFAGQSLISNKLGLRIAAATMPIGVCTSSGTVGHSLSMGEADAVTVLSSSTALADAAATRLGNEIRRGRSLEPALDVAQKISGITGVVMIQDTRLGAWGDVELVKLDESG